MGPMPLAPAISCCQTWGAVLPAPQSSPRPVMTTRRLKGYLPPFAFFSMYSTASLTVLIFSASSSGISRSKASSNCITSSTTSSESAPRSSWKLAPGVTSASSTCSCSTMICLTFSSTAMRVSPRICSELGILPGLRCIQFRLPTIPARGRGTQPLRQKMATGPETPSLPGGSGPVKAWKAWNMQRKPAYRNRTRKSGGFSPKIHRRKAYIRRSRLKDLNMQAFIAALAALAGILLGYWLCHASAKAEKAQLTRSADERLADLNTLRAELASVQALSATRAGFESLAAEREKSACQLTSERDALRSELQAKTEAERLQSATIGQLEAELRNERQNLAEKLALLEAAKQTLAHQFESLAADILEKKSKTFSESSQKDLGTLLSPLRDQINEFRDKVEQAQSDSKTGVTKLETLIGTLGGLNQQLTEEARNLTTALRGSSKAQGDWGELIVRNLLEKAGLREGEQFRVQETFDAAGDVDARQRKSRPDVIVNLPGGRHLVIDSKVSLNAYTDSANAATEE